MDLTSPRLWRAQCEDEGSCDWEVERDGLPGSPPHTVFQVATRLPYPLCVSRTSSGSPLHAQLLCVTQQDPLDPQPLVQPLTSVPPHSWAPPTHFTLLSKAQHGNWLPQLWMSLLLLCLLSPFPFPSPSLSTASSHHQPSCSQQNTLMARIFV